MMDQKYAGYFYYCVVNWQTFLGISLLNPWGSGVMINSAIIKMGQTSITKQWIKKIVYTSMQNFCVTQK